MADTGFKFPGFGSSVGGFGEIWSTPTAITSDNGSDADQQVPSLSGAETLRGTSFVFSNEIPVGATIDGVEYELIDYTGRQLGGE